jgi:hypothetical protein
MEVILYVFYDLPCFFSIAELEVFLGYRANKNNVAGALHLMEEVGMIIMWQDSVGTKQYYLGNFGMELLGSQELLPDINNRAITYLLSISIHTQNGLGVSNIRASIKTTRKHKSHWRIRLLILILRLVLHLLRRIRQKRTTTKKRKPMMTKKKLKKTKTTVHNNRRPTKMTATTMEYSSWISGKITNNRRL